MKKIDIEKIIGFSEFMDIVGTPKNILSTIYWRQNQGKKVKKPLPTPIKIIASTPLWSIDQAIEYKAKYFAEDSKTS